VNTIKRLLILLLLQSFATVAVAGEVLPYDQKLFSDLTVAGKDVVLEVHADWCPTCRKQKPVVAQLITTSKYESSTVFVVDLAKTKDVRKALHVSQQSTLIVFHGASEKGRATGITSSEDIASLLDSGL